MYLPDFTHFYPTQNTPESEKKTTLQPHIYPFNPTVCSPNNTIFFTLLTTTPQNPTLLTTIPRPENNSYPSYHYPTTWKKFLPFIPLPHDMINSYPTYHYLSTWKNSFPSCSINPTICPLISFSYPLHPKFNIIYTSLYEKRIQPHCLLPYFL